MLSSNKSNIKALNSHKQQATSVGGYIFITCACVLSNTNEVLGIFFHCFNLLFANTSFKEDQLCMS